jgi:multiple sugar transport system substrate-binding protein
VRGGPRQCAGKAPLTLLLFVISACRPAPNGKVHITYWEKWTGAEGEAIQAVVDSFNRSQDRIEVECLSVSGADRKTLVATAGGDPPDLAGLYTFNIAPFADNAALTPLDDFIRADGYDVSSYLDRYDPVFAKMCQYRATVWALPSAPVTVALYWNKGLFREAGLDPDRPPRTIAELDAFAQKLTRRDAKTGALVQLGFLPQEPAWWDWAYPLWFGGRLWDGEHITANQPENVEALTWVESYTRTNGLDNLQRFTAGFGKFSSPQSSFFSGKIAMALQGVFFAHFIRQYAPGLEYGVAAWPETPHGPENFTIADADVLVIPRGSKHPKEAWEFIRFLSSNNPSAASQAELTGIEQLCYAQEKASPLRAWSPYFEQHHPNPHIDLFRTLGRSPHAVAFPQLGIWEEYRRELTSAFDDVRLLRKPPARALQNCQARIEASWEHHLALLNRRLPAGSGSRAP